MIDVKKLITGFLILATAAGASGLIFSFINIGSPSATAQTMAEPTIDGAGTATSSLLATNAFVDTGSLQGNAAEVLSDTVATSTETIAEDPTNLTDVFADSFLDGLVSANPTGEFTDASGDPEFAAPDLTSVAQEISTNPVVQDFTAPNWNTNSQTQLIKTTQASSPADVAQYGDSLNTVFNKYFVSTDLQTAMNSQNPDPNELTYAASQIQGALTDTLNIQTPSSLVPLQKSLVQVLAYEGNMAQLSQLAATDPVKASLELSDEQTQYNNAITNLQTQIQSASSLGLLFGKNEPSASVPYLAQLLGVKPAEAIFGIGDITFDPSTFGQLLLKYVDDIVLQILKNTLVSLIQRKVLTWIQGSGAPQFVTNWASQMVNSFQTAALNHLNSMMACVPSSQTPFLKVVLSTPNISSANSNSCSAEFNGQLGNNLTNLSNMYNNFTNFNDYFTVMGPTGNAWGNLITLHDSATTAGSANQTANQNKNAANQGWTGSQVCDDGSNPTTGQHATCSSGLEPFENASGTPSCGTASVVMVANGGFCADGSQPKSTSPGTVTGQAFNTALQSGSQNITSANTIAGLLDSLLSSLLNTLAQSAINYSSAVVNSTLSGTSAPSDSGLTGIAPSTLTTTATSTASAVQCLPSVQPASISTSTGQAIATISAGGGSIDSTCAINSDCPSTENADGTPIYNWSAPGSTQASLGTPITGSSLSLTYTTPGTYYATVTASTDNSTSSCEIDVQ